ncbi:glutathione S-transferase family protein [Devosia algicola]|uniref:Glutathione S-transferase family protein n=1 Tax=Devosia algicola TaxID=3026418 RepID=A0ABY7YQ11_9HYPH|nr:glutathione S-transferase family protein [Devosia algicola]WDR03346.1 glutathione S-transferase family protein [Devosia algicola]
MGSKNSANVQKATWALAELGIDYEHVPLGGSFKGVDTPEYLALNPHGLVPTLRDGDLVVWESHAIVRYLAAAYGAGSLWPLSPRDRAPIDQWTDWAETTFQPAWIGVFGSIVRVPKEKQDPSVIAAGVAKATTAFGQIEKQLDGRDYLAGNFSYADIVSGVALYRWFTMDIARPSLANVEAWYARLQQRSAFAENVIVSYADLYVR